MIHHYINNLAKPITYSLIKDVITFILTGLGIYVAFSGLSTWKKQMRGKREIDTSHNLHYSLLKLRDAIRFVRNPAIWNNEYDKALDHFRKEDPDKSEDELKKRSNTLVYKLRWEKITDAYTKMEPYLLRAEVLWGPEIIDKIKPLNKKVVWLNIKLSQYLNPELRTEDIERIEDIVYDQSNNETGEKDNFSKEVDSIINDIVDYIKTQDLAVDIYKRIRHNV